MRRYVGISVLIALLLTACGGGDIEKAGSNDDVAPPPTATATPTTSADPSAAPSDNPLPDESPSTLPRRACEPRTDYSPNAGVPGQTYIRAVTRPTRTWGRACDVLSPGDKCMVGWDGSYILLVGNDAHLTFQAWAKGQDKPFKELTVGPLPAEHKFRKVGFPVEIPPDVKEVAFRIVLRDSAKTPVAISDAFVYEINCRPE